MSPLAALTLVWLGGGAPEGPAKAALEQWAAARGGGLEEARPAPVDGGERGGELARACDRALDEARDAITSGDEETARRTLRRVEQTLREHPEILPAAWLMAERHRLEAQLDDAAAPDRAADLRLRADALEGARAAPFGAATARAAGAAGTARAAGATATARAAGATATARAAAAAPLSIAIAVHGAERRALFWDGAETNGDVSTTAGEHHLVVLRGGAVAWSGWVSVLASGPLAIWAPGAPACSADDLAGVAIAREGGFAAPAGIRCAAWVAAAPVASAAAIDVARCAGSQCEPPTRLFFGAAPAATAAEDTKGTRGWPAWATWSIAGITAAAATSIVLWRTGAFDRDGGPSVRMLYDGSKL